MLRRLLSRTPPKDPEPIPGNRPAMSHQDELERDLAGHTLVDDALLLRWFREGYSTSKHLLTLYSLAVGLRARVIVEVGFGRSSFVLARAAAENGGRFFSCDMRDFSYLLSPEERAVTTFLHGPASRVWNHPEVRAGGIDLAFLDYFSDPGLPADFTRREIAACLALVRQNGVIAVHDTAVPGYRSAETFATGSFGARVERVTLPYQYGLGVLRRLDPSPLGSVPCHWVKKAESGAGPA
jgi:predicted O-methyltransferase YrrM